MHSQYTCLLIFSLFVRCEQENKAVVSILVGDDDSSTISKVRRSVDHEIKKWSDIVHAKRSFGSALYAVKPKYKSLTPMIIEYLQRCFGYALKQNKDDPEGVRKNLRAIVPHAFGEHTDCNASWCGYLKDPSNYTHRGLPHGKDLEDQNLRKSLEEIIEVYALNAEKLAPPWIKSAQRVPQ